MEKFQTKNIMIFVVALIITGSVAYYLSTDKASNKKIEVRTQETNGFADIAIYKNDKYGFTFKYPKNLKLTDNFEGFNHIAVSWTQNLRTGQDFNSGTKIISVIVNDKKSTPGEEGYYYRAEMRIGASDKPEEVKLCLKKGYGSENLGMSTLNGKDYSVFHVSSVGMSQYANDIIYRTINNNICYSIESIITGGGTGKNADKVSRSPELMQEDTVKIQEIINTIKFI